MLIKIHNMLIVFRQVAYKSKKKQNYLRYEKKNVKKVLLFCKSWNLLLLHVETNPYYSIQKKGTEKTYGQITKC